MLVVLFLRALAALHLWEGDVRPGVRMSRGTLLNWMSTSKVVAVIAVGQLWERGVLELSAPVARYIPAFGKCGKETILVEQRNCVHEYMPIADCPPLLFPFRPCSTARYSQPAE